MLENDREVEAIVQRHLLTLRYSGLLADQGAMDLSMAGAVQVGARRLLSASAHYYIYGFVPVRLAAKTRDFAIVELPTEPGSVIREYAIVMADALSGAAAYDILKDHLNSVIIFAAASAMKIFLERDRWAVEIGSLFERQPEMPFSRTHEPILPWPVKASNLAKLRGSDHSDQAEMSPEDALIDRTVEAIEDLAHPVDHGGALKFELSLDGDYLFGLDAQSPGKSNAFDREIAEAILQIRRGKLRTTTLGTRDTN